MPAAGLSGFTYKLELERQKIKSRKTDIFTEMILPGIRKKAHLGIATRVRSLEN